MQFPRVMMMSLTEIGLVEKVRLGCIRCKSSKHKALEQLRCAVTLLHSRGWLQLGLDRVDSSRATGNNIPRWPTA